MRGSDTRGTPVCSEVSRRTPVRDGDRYCSPACGLGCKWDAYLRATEAANDLCRMLGERWRPRVWENLGWHFEAERGSVTVRYRAGNGGKALPGFSCTYDGPGKQFGAESATSPNDAVADVRRQVEAHVESLQRGLVTLVADGQGMPEAGFAPLDGSPGKPRMAALPAGSARTAGRRGTGPGPGRDGVLQAG